MFTDPNAVTLACNLGRRGHENLPVPDGWREEDRRTPVCQPWQERLPKIVIPAALAFRCGFEGGHQ
jgi:hypothetical protein